MTSRPDFSEFSQFALHLAAAAGEAILPFFRQGTEVETKPHYGWDPVTEGDRAGERAMRQLIDTHFPDHGILGEEYGEKQTASPFTWVLDPVDGTRSFVMGLPIWATLIGLLFEGEPVVGVMSQPFVGEIFHGGPNGAWWRRGNVERPLHVRACEKLDEAIAGTTAPELYRSPAERRGFETLARRVRMMRFGGDAYFHVMAAAGQLDLALDAGLKAYDIVALIPIVRGAGGVVGCWDGGSPAQGGNILCAGSPALFEKAASILRG